LAAQIRRKEPLSSSDDTEDETVTTSAPAQATQPGMSKTSHGRKRRRKRFVATLLSRDSDGGSNTKLSDLDTPQEAKETKNPEVNSKPKPKSSPRPLLSWQSQSADLHYER